MEKTNDMGGDKLMKCRQVWVLPAQKSICGKKRSSFTNICDWGCVGSL